MLNESSEMSAILKDYKEFCRKADDFIENFKEYAKKRIGFKEGEEEWKKTQLSLTK